MKAFIILSIGIGLALASPIVYTYSTPLHYAPILHDPVPLSFRKPALISPEDVDSELFNDPPPLVINGNIEGPNFMEELPHSKIVGGEPASITEVPYQLKLSSIAKNGSVYQCGASILNSKWALTAAHCFSGIQLKSVKVHAGYTDFGKPKTGDEYELWVVEIVISGDWNPRTLKGDIALLRVDGTFKTDAKSSKAVKLVDAGQNPTGNALASGWGATTQGSPPTNTLMKVTLPVLDDFDCLMVYRNYDLDGMMCAGFTDGTKDTCQGDSGGPLVLDGVQIGIVSFGKGCANPGYPGVYTRVSHYRQWIDENITK